MDLVLAHRWLYTENCNRSCSHCFNANERHGEQLDKNKYFKWLGLNAPYLGNAELKIFGGEPTIHNDFVEMAEKSLDYYGIISLFTNGSNMDMLQNSLKMFDGEWWRIFYQPLAALFLFFAFLGLFGPSIVIWFYRLIAQTCDH